MRPSPGVFAHHPSLAALACVVLLGACTSRFADVAVRPALDIGEWRLDSGLGDPYERGKEQLRAGKPALALAAFQLALARQGWTVDNLNAVAIAYAEIGRDDLATRYFQRALDLDPDLPATYNNIGFAALRNGNPMLAQLYLEKAYALAPDDPRVAANHLLVQEVTSATAEARPVLLPTAMAAAATDAAGPRIERVDRNVLRIVTGGKAPAVAEDLASKTEVSMDRSL